MSNGLPSAFQPRLHHVSLPFEMNESQDIILVWKGLCTPQKNGNGVMSLCTHTKVDPLTSGSKTSSSIPICIISLILDSHLVVVPTLIATLPFV